MRNGHLTGVALTGFLLGGLISAQEPGRRWLLEAGPEGAAVSRTRETPQLTLDISALAQLLFGQVSPSHAVRIGRAEALPDAPLGLWDAMWRTNYAPFCPDGF